jgi:hypothetical protein
MPFPFKSLPPEVKLLIVDQVYFDSLQHPNYTSREWYSESRLAKFSLVSKELRQLCAKHLYRVRTCRSAHLLAL